MVELERGQVRTEEVGQEPTSEVQGASQPEFNVFPDEATWNYMFQATDPPEWPMKILDTYRAWKIRCVLVDDMAVQSHAILVWEVNEPGSGSRFTLLAPDRIAHGYKRVAGGSYVEESFPCVASRRAPAIHKDEALHVWIDKHLRSRGWR